MVDPDGGTTTYTYHDNNRLETLTNPNSEVTTWAYTNIGLVSTMSLNSGSVTTHAYDTAGQTTGITHKKASDTIIEQLAYTYDDAGNRRTVTENSGDVSTWTYDNANQLTVEQRSGGSAYTTTYTYDDVGNRATMVDSTGTTTYTYNAGNRLTLITDPSSNLTTNTYDNNGNLTVTNANGTVTTNTWTYENRLRTVTLATPATTTFTYDGDGLRRQAVTAAGTINFIWDGQDVLLETDVSNNTQVTYTQTPDIYGNLVSQRRSTTTSFYHHDALGSTLALTDANENVTDTYKYYAFGETLTSSGSTTNPFQYVGNLGYYNESALSLQYLRARYYQPSTGRFVSVDPVGLPPDYAYVSNNPATGTDPSGLWMPRWPFAKLKRMRDEIEKKTPDNHTNKERMDEILELAQYIAWLGHYPYPLSSWKMKRFLSLEGGEVALSPIYHNAVKRHPDVGKAKQEGCFRSWMNKYGCKEGTHRNVTCTLYEWPMTKPSPFSRDKYDLYNAIGDFNLEGTGTYEVYKSWWGRCRVRFRIDWRLWDKYRWDRKDEFEFPYGIVIPAAWFDDLTKMSPPRGKNFTEYTTWSEADYRWCKCEEEEPCEADK